MQTSKSLKYLSLWPYNFYDYNDVDPTGEFDLISRLTPLSKTLGECFRASVFSCTFHCPYTSSRGRRFLSNIRASNTR